MRARYRPQAEAAGSREELAAAVNAMLATLGASHTRYYTPDDPAFYQLADIFSGALQHRGGLLHVFPNGEVSYPGIGVFTEADDQGRTFVDRRDRRRPCASGGAPARRRDPVGRRPAVPAGRILPRQGRDAGRAVDPADPRRSADADRRHPGRSSSGRHVSEGPQGQRPRHFRRRRRPHRLRARLVLCRAPVSGRARGPDRRRPAARTPTRSSGTCATDGAARSRNISTCSTRIRRR